MRSQARPERDFLGERGCLTPSWSRQSQLVWYFINSAQPILLMIILFFVLSYFKNFRTVFLLVLSGSNKKKANIFKSTICASYLLFQKKCYLGMTLAYHHVITKIIVLRRCKSWAYLFASRYNNIHVFRAGLTCRRDRLVDRQREGIFYYSYCSIFFFLLLSS